MNYALKSGVRRARDMRTGRLCLAVGDCQDKSGYQETALVRFGDGVISDRLASDIKILPDAIIGLYDKQVWDNNYPKSVGDERFDCTLFILSCDIGDIKSVENCDDSSDAIGNHHVEWDGPHSVYVENSICEYFDVECVADVAEQDLEDARLLYVISGVNSNSVIERISEINPQAAARVERMLMHIKLSDKRLVTRNESDGFGL